MEIGAQDGVQGWGHQACTVSEPKWGSCWHWESEAAAPTSTAPALLWDGQTAASNRAVPQQSPLGPCLSAELKQAFKM